MATPPFAAANDRVLPPFRNADESYDTGAGDARVLTGQHHPMSHAILPTVETSYALLANGLISITKIWISKI